MIDVVAHPQAVFGGLPEGDGRIESMSLLVAQALVLSDDEPDLKRRRDLDWDLWVQYGNRTFDAPEHMHVLSFGAESLGLMAIPSGGTSVSYMAGNRGPTMSIPDGLPADVERLVRHELVPWLQALEVKPVLSRSVGDWGVRESVRGNDSRYDMVPFVLDADGFVIAGAFRRSGDTNSWVWALPHEPERPELWLAAAMQDWHRRTPDRVPTPNPWRTRHDWMTSDELGTLESLRELEDDREQWLRAYAEKREALEGQLLRANLEAEGGVRRLLTETDEPLVEAVASALRSLGFEVTDEDQIRAEGEGKAHDLNVVDPDRPGRAVIVEVKGFGKGGRGALAQASRQTLRYAVANYGTPPDACWLVLNQFRNLDPAERPLLLQGADEDISIFAETGGLLIDSRDLFRLVRDVEDGRKAAAQVRAVLAAGAGRLVLDPPTES